MNYLCNTAQPILHAKKFCWMIY